MKKLFLFISFFSVFMGAKAQQWEWAIQENVKKIAVDSAGNVFTQNDSTIKRFNSNGSFKWQKQFTGDLSICGMVADNSGNLYIAGSFTNFSMDAVHFTSKGNLDVFFCKIDSSGILLWNKITGGPNNDNVSDLYLTKKQKIVICGHAGMGAVIGSTFFSETEFFTARYDLNGNLEMHFNHSGGEAWEVSADTSGNIYLVGRINTNDTLDFGNGVILYGYDISDPFGSHFIAKFTSSGNILWAKDLGSNYYTPFENLGVDNNGNFYLTKWQRYGGFDLYKSDSSGNHIWARNISGLYGWCGSLCIDNNDSIWTTGTGDPWYHAHPFIWEFDSSGILTLPTPTTISGYGNNIANDYNNNIYVSGEFNDTAVFGTTTLYASPGNYFLAKLNRNLNIITSVRNSSEPPNEIFIFPNPTSGIFTVVFNHQNANTKICVSDLLGNCVLDNVSIKSGRQEIDLSNQAKGIYFMEIVSNGERTVKKVVVQ